MGEAPRSARLWHRSQSKNGDTSACGSTLLGTSWWRSRSPRCSRFALEGWHASRRGAARPRKSAHNQRGREAAPPAGGALWCCRGESADPPFGGACPWRPAPQARSATSRWIRAPSPTSTCWCCRWSTTHPPWRRRPARPRRWHGGAKLGGNGAGRRGQQMVGGRPGACALRAGCASLSLLSSCVRPALEQPAPQLAGKAPPRASSPAGTCRRCAPALRPTAKSWWALSAT